jgi:putative oxygen-independent coproporphyrinogen III oxidase
MTDGSPGLYIHVPFCSGKCPYCDFYSINAPQWKTGYLEALDREASLYREHGLTFDTLYIGGGTPSQLNESEWDFLFECLAGFDFSPEAEITVEVNPEDVTRGSAQSLIRWRVNRVSVGAQSFLDQNLRELGRRHTVEQTCRAIEHLREAGVTNIGLDLIYGLPGQDVRAWHEDLDRALQFHPEHVSCYQLTVEAGTVWAGWVKSGRRRLPDEELGRELFLFTCRYLEDHGYGLYEVSNYSLGRGNRSRHNLKYWRREPYIGLGPSAHSFLQGVRWWNDRSVRRYCERLRVEGTAVSDREVLTSEQVLLERIYLGLRTADGVAMVDFMERGGAGDLVREWLASDWAVIMGDRIVLTAHGLVVADRLVRDWHALDE